MEKKWTDIVLTALVLFEGLALAALAQFAELIVGEVGCTELEGVVNLFATRGFLDGVELLVEIGYRCVGMLKRSVTTAHRRKEKKRATDVGRRVRWHRGLWMAVAGRRCLSGHGLEAGEAHRRREGRRQGSA